MAEFEPGWRRKVAMDNVEFYNSIPTWRRDLAKGYPDPDEADG